MPASKLAGSPANKPAGAPAGPVDGNGSSYRKSGMWGWQ
jgi:hypothetical protein